MAAAAQRSPWAEPFGIQNFWDILGVALAILLALATAALVLARRVRMKRYLMEIGDLADRHPVRYAEALVARGHLSSTRINAFGRAFYRLPPAFMIRLQSVLADGRSSQQDHRALSELLEEIELPDESRDAVRAQIDLWATQDQAVARMTRLARRKPPAQSAEQGG